MPAPSWRKRTHSLHAMLLALVGLTLLPVLALSLYSHMRDRAQEREAAVAEAAHGAGMVARALTLETDNARLFLELLAANPLIRQCAQPDCQPLLTRFARMSNYSNLLLLRPDGTVLASAAPAPDGGGLAKDQAFAAAIQGQSFAVGVTPSPPDQPQQGATLSYAAPAHGPDGSIQMVLMAQHPLADVAATFHAAGLPQGTSLVLAGQNGRVLYRLPEKPGYTGAQLPAPQTEMLKTGQDDLKGWGTGLDGVERYYVMKRLDICRGETCYVRVGIPKDAVYAASAEKLARNLGGLAAIVVLILALARLWARRSILAPSEKLMQTIRELDGGNFSARTKLSSKAGELGEIGALVDHLAEVLERHKAEQEAASRALFDSEERLRAVFNASSDGVLLLVPDGKVLAMNESAAQRRSKSARELIGANILDLIPEYVRNGRRARYEEVLRLGQPLRFEEERDGRTYAIRLHPVRNQAGTLVQIASFSRDITERKLAERALMAAKEAAEAASHAKSAFLSNMSHELRTPLNGLMGMLQLMQEAKGEDQQREYLGWAVRSAQHITALVNDILDFAALGAGTTRLEYRPFLLPDVLGPLRTEFAALAEAKGLAFALDLAPELQPLALMGDPLHLGKVLRQLLDNAVKFTAEGGITLSAQLAHRDDATCTLCLTVQDTGIGIAPESLPRLFEPFVQAESPMTKSFSGAGLGLSLARELVSRMGGALVVNSTPGVGTTCSVSMSFSPAARD